MDRQIHPLARLPRSRTRPRVKPCSTFNRPPRRIWKRCWKPAGRSLRSIRELEARWLNGYVSRVNDDDGILSLDELRARLRPFCEKHHIRRLEVFGSAARGRTGPDSDVDLLVTLDESWPVSTDELLEMAGEAEELVGAPVDFVLRPSLERSRNHVAREHILSTAVCVYGS